MPVPVRSGRTTWAAPPWRMMLALPFATPAAVGENVYFTTAVPPFPFKATPAGGKFGSPKKGAPFVPGDAIVRLLGVAFVQVMLPVGVEPTNTVLKSSGAPVTRG